MEPTIEDLSSIGLAKLHYEAMQNAALSFNKPSRTAMGEYVVPPGGKALTSLGDFSPAPSDYSPKVDLTKEAAPQYSITGKAKVSALNNYKASPADNDTSKDMEWKNKSVRMKGKGRMRVYDVTDNAHINDSIGSARYNIENKKVGTYGPKWSVLSRQKEGQNAGPPNALVHPCDTDGFKTPGPNYRPNSGYWGRGPKKSFGTGYKHAPNDNPGPADYTIEEDPTDPKACSLHKRLPPLIAQQQAVHTDSPGPGAYALETQMGKAQAKSVSGRPHDLTKDDFPAPNSYSLRDPIKDAVSCKLTYRPFEHSEVPHPAPTSYTIQTTNLKKAPAYSMRKTAKPSFPDILHYPIIAQNHSVPGPGSYESKQGMTYHNDNPKYSMGKRANHNKNDMPGPNHYRIAVICRPDAKKPPAFSMGSRREAIDKRVSPGPAAYNLQQPLGTSGYSMTGRTKVKEAFETPAPNAYGRSSQTRKGAAVGPSATLKSRASPYVFSGFRTTKVID